jgi:hypothetical protein
VTPVEEDKMNSNGNGDTETIDISDTVTDNDTLGTDQVDEKPIDNGGENVE